MRRKDRQLSEAETFSILEKGEYGVLSLMTDDHGVYGLPVNFAFWNNSIYFHCATEGRKLDAIKKNGQVSFCVVGKTELLPSQFGTRYESAIAHGWAVSIEGSEKRDALIQLLKKYSPDFMVEGLAYIDRAFEKTVVVKISIQTVSGKARKK